MQGENLNRHYPHEYAGVGESDKGVGIVTRLLKAVKLHGMKPNSEAIILTSWGLAYYRPR